MSAGERLLSLIQLWALVLEAAAKRNPCSTPQGRRRNIALIEETTHRKRFEDTTLALELIIINDDDHATAHRKVKRRKSHAASLIQDF